MLAFEAYGYLFVKNTVEKGYTIDEEKIIYTWQPISGILVTTTIEPTAAGHIRTHQVSSEIECRAYDCGFALSSADEEGPCGFRQKQEASQAEMKNRDGYCRVASLQGGGKGEILIPDPNTNLMHPKTRIPMVVYEIRPGKQTIVTEVNYL